MQLHNIKINKKIKYISIIIIFVLVSILGIIMVNKEKGIKYYDEPPKNYQYAFIEDPMKIKDERVINWYEYVKQKTGVFYFNHPIKREKYIFVGAGHRAYTGYSFDIESFVFTGIRDRIYVDGKLNFNPNGSIEESNYPSALFVRKTRDNRPVVIGDINITEGYSPEEGSAYKANFPQVFMSDAIFIERVNDELIRLSLTDPIYKEIVLEVTEPLFQEVLNLQKNEFLSVQYDVIDSKPFPVLRVFERLPYIQTKAFYKTVNEKNEMITVINNDIYSINIGSEELIEQLKGRIEIIEDEEVIIPARIKENQQVYINLQWENGRLIAKRVFTE